MSSSKSIAYLAYLVGIIFILIGVYYFLTPAQSLPHFMPGYLAGSAKVHIKHGVGSLLLGLAALALGWFQGGSSQSTPE